MIELDPRYEESIVLQSSPLIHEARIVDKPPLRPARPSTNPIHPIFNFTKEHILGSPEIFSSAINENGEEVGRFWDIAGRRIGWEGNSFRTITTLATNLAAKKPFKDLIAFEFALDEIFKWLRDSLEKKTTETLPERLKKRCSEEIRDVEIWIPLHQTYARAHFPIGNVIFKTITKEFLDPWYGRFTDTPDPAVQTEMNRQRSKIQATVAACTQVRAEPKRASQIAFERAVDATSLLRFISEANWTCAIRSYVTPLGMQREDTVEELIVENGAIKTKSARVLRKETSAWNVDQNRHLLPGILEQIHDLALDRKSTELRRALFEALLVYSKNSLTLDPAEKLVFVLVSLESLLLRDSSEPIQGNLAERMAFLVGENLEQRKEIVAVTKKVYVLRSRFVHHGRAIEELDALDKFLFFAWQALASILRNLKKFASREELISYLNDRKLT